MCTGSKIRGVSTVTRSYINTVLLVHWPSGWVIPKTQKWYRMPPCLTLSIIRYGSRVKWSNPGKGIAPFPTPWCSSYWKGSLQGTLDYGRQLYLLISPFGIKTAMYFWIHSMQDTGMIVTKSPDICRNWNFYQNISYLWPCR